MPITVADLVAPVGPVELAFFEDELGPGAVLPATQMDDRLNEYIRQAYVKAAADGIPLADQDPPAKNYALYLTFDALYLIKSDAPATENLGVMGLPSETFYQQQIDAFQARAKAYLAAYNVQVAGLGTIAVAAVGYRGGERKNVYEW